MNGSTVVSSRGPPAFPDDATAAPVRSVRRTYGIVGPPTVSTAPAQRADSSGLPLSAVTSSRGTTPAAPSARSRASSSGLPVAAQTSWPRAASIATAVLPTPPLAPVTSTGPSPGRRPRASSAATDIAAVNPAVPTAIASRALNPSGSGTTQPAGSRVYSP